MCWYLFSDNIQISRKEFGAALKVEISCNACQASYTKYTSSERQRMFVLNYLLSCSILFAGGLPTKVLRYENSLCRKTKVTIGCDWGQ